MKTYDNNRQRTFTSTPNIEDQINNSFERYNLVLEKISELKDIYLINEIDPKTFFTQLNDLTEELTFFSSLMITLSSIRTLDRCPHCGERL